MPRGRPKKVKDKEVELAELIKESAEIESEDVEILPVEQVEIMSLAQINQAKQELAIRRAQVMLMVDKNKMNQMLQVMGRMESILRTDEEGTRDKTLTALDRKSLAEAYNKWQDSLNKISRLDSVDSGGKAGRINIKIEYG